ncbi:MAG TPA: PRC-barrel domain-containing protein [Bradyrhizobium sp.]|uniref:PRC-barrel domain-containing protein n=1 Tax=Bradyrhizobium sp. TaxID=376 RepID=UPI002BBFAD8A|nr:PRC-barrel domain-containing protein [Bradyrhizobium sp.]HLZ01698.1 PRC-barrel domain-containing protein [Bradyrhizobium sp.]
MKRIAVTATMATVLSTAALAQSATPPEATHALTSLPADAVTVTDYYKQNVYDPSETKIGEVADVLVDKDGRAVAVIVSAGGFLGAGEKDVAVPFSAVRRTQRDGKWYLVMNATKDALKAAPGYKYDKSKTQWMPDTK